MPVKGEIRPDEFERAGRKRQRGKIGLRETRAANAERLADRSGKEASASSYRRRRAGSRGTASRADRSVPNTGASGKRSRNAGRSSPIPQPASSTTRRRHLDVIEALTHALGDFARQERDVVEIRGATVEDLPQTPGIVGRTASYSGCVGHGGRAGEECEVYSPVTFRSARTPFRSHRMPFLDNFSLLAGVWTQLAGRLRDRLLDAALPDLCALCGNGSRQTICAGCDDAYWNEARLRCTCVPRRCRDFRRGNASRYRCGACVSSPPPFDATLALADYRPPLDMLALGLKFRARLMLGREFAMRLNRLANDLLDPSDAPDVIAPGATRAPAPDSSAATTRRGKSRSRWAACCACAATRRCYAGSSIPRAVASRSRRPPAQRRAGVRNSKARAGLARGGRRRRHDVGRHPRSGRANAEGSRCNARNLFRRAAHPEKLI